MTSWQIILLFLHTLAVCGAILWWWFDWRRRMGLVVAKPPDAADAPADDASASDGALVPEAGGDAVADYRTRALVPEEDQALMDTLAAVMGPDTAIYPRVAAWAWIEPARPEAGVGAGLSGEAFDFLLCDAATRQPFCAVHVLRHRTAESRLTPEFRRICESAGVQLIELDPDAAATPDRLRQSLGL